MFCRFSFGIGCLRRNFFRWFVVFAWFNYAGNLGYGSSRVILGVSVMISCLFLFLFLLLLLFLACFAGSQCSNHKLFAKVILFSLLADRKTETVTSSDYF